tara:strand:+ start:51 stop:533 length:483 start_codon:yes stop_codon:yes gene_type:complete
MEKIAKGSKRKKFVSNFKQSLSEFWIGWFGDLIDLSDLFESPKQKDNLKIEGFLFFITYCHYVIFFIDEGNGFFSIFSPLFAFFYYFMMFSILIYLPILIVFYTFGFFYRIIYYRDLKISKSLDYFLERLENYFLKKLIYYSTLFSLFILINFLLYIFEW